MFGTVRVLDVVAAAQGIQAVALPRMHLPRHHQGVGDLAQRGRGQPVGQARELRVDKANVEGRVMDDHLGAAQVVGKLRRHILEMRLVGKKLVGDAVHLDRRLVDLAIRLQVHVEIVPGQAAVDHLDATDLDDTVPLLRLQAGGFSIQYDLALVLFVHRQSSSMPRLAS